MKSAEATFENNYTDNFGYQWNEFQKTQLDRYEHGLDQSKKRFLTVTEWEKEDLNGCKILEVGSGAGRFTKVALETTEADIYSVDYSSAVEANRRNNHNHPRLNLKRASVYDLPYQRYSFEKVFCFGMLQHTPDPQKTIQSLAEMVKPGGELIVDFYPRKGWYTMLHAKYFVRPFTKGIDHRKLLKWIQNNISVMIRLYKGLHRIGLGLFSRFIPIVDIYHVLPAELSKEQEREWAILDTFDMLSPAYDRPQRVENVVNWIMDSGLEVTFAGPKEYQPGHLVYFVKAIRSDTDFSVDQ